MIVKLPTEHLLELLTLKGGYTGSSESTLVKISHCWKSHVTAHLIYLPYDIHNSPTNPQIGLFGVGPSLPNQYIGESGRKSNVFLYPRL